MDLAFAQAVRRASTQPPVKSAEVSQLNDQLRQAIGAAAADQVQVTELTAAVAKAAPSAVQGLTDRLELAKAQLALDQDEVDDARQDLQRAGGDPQGRIQSIVAEHEAASRASDSTRIVDHARPGGARHARLRRRGIHSARQGRAARRGQARGRFARRGVQAAARQHRGARRSHGGQRQRAPDARFVGGAARAHAQPRGKRKEARDARSAHGQPDPPFRHLRRVEHGRVVAGARDVQPGAARRGGDPRDHSRRDAALALVRASWRARVSPIIAGRRRCT